MRDQSPRVGAMLQQYRLVELLGSGGMGVVYLAEDTRLGRKVAIKLLPPSTSGEAARSRRLAQEARAAAALAHPSIAAVYELGESDGEMFIAVEYVQGNTLRSFVRHGGLDPETILDIAIDIAGALAAAHAAGVVHRDIKPENVMRTADGLCKVLDFGLALFEPPADNSVTRSRLTQPGMLVGTVAYMSPEQLEGTAVDFRSDIFSFGALLYELAAGVHPFQAATTASTMTAVLTSEPPPLADRSSRHPAELDRIVRKCMRKRREDRYQSTRDLVVDLKQLRRDSSSVRGADVSRVRPARVQWLFWGHNISTCLLGAPFALQLTWSARGILASTTGNALFLAEALSIGVLISLRVILMAVALANPAALRREEVQRLRRWILAGSLSVVAGLLGMSAAVVPVNIGLGAAIGIFGAAGIVATLVINPAIDRSPFEEME